jgi:hypothetical protein
MSIHMFAVERMDTWIFRVSVAVPVVCLAGLLLWHLVAYLGGRVRGKPKILRHAPEPPARLPGPSSRTDFAPVILSTSPEDTPADRARLARDLLDLTREDFHRQRFLSCLERCKLLAGTFADRPEAAEAKQLLAQIKNDPQRLQQVCAAQLDLLAQTYLDLAESWLRKGETEEAAASWQKILQSCPQTAGAQKARECLRNLGVAEHHS